MKYTGSSAEPLPRITVAASSRSSGTFSAAARWTSRYSTGVRTSIRPIDGLPRTSSASRRGLTVGTLMAKSLLSGGRVVGPHLRVAVLDEPVDDLGVGLD